jgi:hypothetical protein
MAGKQQYQSQLEALKELEAYLRRIPNHLQDIMRGYTTKVSDLVDRGLPLEVHDVVKTQFYMQSQNLVTQSCEIINGQAIPFVRHHIQTLEQLM